MILIGTSGWQYSSWKELFYPHDVPQREWLPYFSARFPTVELNNSFYMLPSEQSFDRWREVSAPGFVIAVKANRFITHLKRMRDPKEPVELFWSRARRLGSKLGPVLFQFPPRFPVDPSRLRDFLSVLPSEMRAAFEFRDRTWEIDEVFGMLDEARAAFVLADRPGARVPEVVCGGWAYIRFHEGQPGISDYTRDKLRRWADRIAGMSAGETYVYFNNDPGGAAVRDASTLAEMLQARGADVTPLRARASA